MKNAKVKNIDLDRTTRQIKVLIDAKDSIYIQEPSFKQHGSVMLLNSAAIVDGFNLILEHHFVAVDAIKKMLSKTPFKTSEEKQELIDALKVMLSLASDPRNEYERRAHKKAAAILEKSQEQY